MNIGEKDRIGQYLVPHLNQMIFDELSESYLEKAGLKDILLGVPVPLRKTELNKITTLSIARDMAFVIGCDPSFKYRENYIAYILKAFDKRFADALIADGVDGAQKKDFDYACIQFRAAMLIDPDNANAYHCYGRACRDAYLLGEEEEFIGRFKAEALEAFEVATLKNPQLADAHYFLGYAYLNMGLYIKAQITWETFMNLSEDKELRTEIAERLLQLKEPVEVEKGYNLVLSGKFEEGIQALLPYKEGTFQGWWPLWYYLGTAYCGIGDDATAEEHYLQVLKLSPSNEQAMEELIRIYETSGQAEKVEKYTKKLALVRDNAKKDRELKAQAEAEEKARQAEELSALLNDPAGKLN